MFLKKNNTLAKTEVYTHSQMLQYDVQEGKYFDLILSDIEMPHVDGMELAAYIRRYLPEIIIIFVTSYLKYAIDAFELSVFRYIPQKELDSRLPQALKDAIAIINFQSEKSYTIQLPSRVEKIPYQKILYIQRERNNSVLVLTNNGKTKIRKSLIQIFQELNSEDFVYIDRGVIVNLAHIEGINNGSVKLKNGICIPASQAKLQYAKLRLTDLWGNHMKRPV